MNSLRFSLIRTVYPLSDGAFRQSVAIHAGYAAVYVLKEDKISGEWQSMTTLKASNGAYGDSDNGDHRKLKVLPSPSGANYRFGLTA